MGKDASEFEAAVIKASIEYRLASNYESATPSPSYFELLPLAERWGKAVDALLKEQGRLVEPEIATTQVTATAGGGATTQTTG